MTRLAALVVDDEPDIRELLALTLERLGLRVDSAADVNAAQLLLRQAPYAFCLTDLRLPDQSGLALVQHVVAKHPEVPIAVITAYGSVDTAVAALKAGAFDFVSKPVDLDVLRRLVRSALKLNETRRIENADGFNAGGALVGEHATILALRTTVAKVARSQVPVHLRGEVGVGKERIARCIHDAGPRSAGPFVPVPCGALAPESLDSEFFGHRKGAFPGALADKDGLIQAAHGGSLFLDEIAELPIAMQVKLLRVIQEKAVRPLGARQPVAVDVRLLSASQGDLAQCVAQGRFRADLFYRIAVIELSVPPLREHPGDLQELAQYLLSRFAAPPTLSQDAMAALAAHDFPGNLRELETILERAAALCDGAAIRAADLGLLPKSAAGSATAVGPASGSLVDEIEQFEREAIRKALQETRYNKTAAAKRLGISFRALRYKLDKLGID